MEIPKALLDQIRGRRVILFLGAGASVGAHHPNNVQSPIGSRLADILAEEFLGSEYKGRPLAQVAALAENDRDLITVQNYIAGICREFHPAPFHKLIPTFTWHLIATTNYDLLMEEAYTVEDRLQDLVPFKSNGEHVEERMRFERSVMFLKLHGCITRTEDPSLPLILTPEQYITHRKNRSRLFDKLLTASAEMPILFVGHSLEDGDIRAILVELEELGNTRPQSYVVTPDAAPADVRYWQSRRYTHIHGSFEEFMNTLNKEIDKKIRPVLAALENIQHPVQHRFKSKDSKPSESLWTLLNRDSDYVHSGIAYETVKPSLFYKGYCADFGPIAEKLDVRRHITDDLLAEVFLRSEPFDGRMEFFLIHSPAGSGKSVFIRRLAWEAATNFNCLCLYAKPEHPLNFDAVRELINLTGDRVYIFVDPVTDSLDWLEQFLVRGRKEGLPITVFAAERKNEWNETCERIHPYITELYELRHLSEPEIVDLLGLLGRYDCLGHLKEMSAARQVELFSHVYSRQLLVALYEATQGRRFSEIIRDEYLSVTPDKARSLYLTVSILHRLGVRTRAGLISRVHGIPFEEFKSELFEPLEHVVFARRDEAIKDFAYRTRHRVVAEMVFEGALDNVNDRYDAYVGILNVLDVDYAADRDGFRGLTNARELIRLFPDAQMVRHLFGIASTRTDTKASLMQQEAIFEMNSTGGSIKRAADLLFEARRLAPHNLTIAHSAAELALKISLEASSDAEKIKYRKEAQEIAQGIINRGMFSAHPYHTLIKLALSDLSDTLDKLDEKSLEERVKSLDKEISSALQKFPMDSYLLSAEAEYSELIHKHPKAVESLEKAVKANPRSAFLALRLASVYQADDNIDGAIAVLGNCLDANPNEKHVHFKLGMLYLVNKPDSTGQIEYHLRHAFTEGDSNYSAQFWYARQLYLDHRIEDARKIYDTLANARVDPRTRDMPQGVVKSTEGKPISFHGTVDWVEASYLFIVRDGANDRIFAHRENSDQEEWLRFKAFTRVSFNLAFAYRGPIAVGIQVATN